MIFHFRGESSHDEFPFVTEGYIDLRSIIELAHLVEQYKKVTLDRQKEVS